MYQVGCGSRWDRGRRAREGYETTYKGQGCHNRMGRLGAWAKQAGGVSRNGAFVRLCWNVERFRVATCMSCRSPVKGSACFHLGKCSRCRVRQPGSGDWRQPRLQGRQARQRQAGTVRGHWVSRIPPKPLETANEISHNQQSALLLYLLIGCRHCRWVPTERRCTGACDSHATCAPITPHTTHTCLSRDLRRHRLTARERKGQTASSDSQTSSRRPQPKCVQQCSEPHPCPHLLNVSYDYRVIALPGLHQSRLLTSTEPVLERIAWSQPPHF